MTDPAERAERARLSLDGLSVGDAFGERFFGGTGIRERIDRREPPRGPWAWTDDTAMAIAVTEVLEAHGGIDEGALAEAFARRYGEQPDRGYGPGAHRTLSAILQGEPWRAASEGSFGGEGSLGNGGAMRVAPVGAYFADDLEQAADHARRSALPTHAHPEGQAGAIAIGVAAAVAWRRRAGQHARSPSATMETVRDHTPQSTVREGIERALGLERDATVQRAAKALGNGSRVTAPDTVPFCVWSAARFGHDYEEALWRTVSALGDRDTTCAIVGGIAVLSAGSESIPRSFLRAREALR